MIVRHARVEPADTVVDLCRGTGIMTEAIPRELSPSGHVVGIDGYDAMLSVARREIDDARLDWVSGRAESFGEHVTRPVDAVITSGLDSSALPASRKIRRPGRRSSTSCTRSP